MTEDSKPHPHLERLRAGDPISILIDCIRHLLSQPMEPNLKSDLARKTNDAMRFYYGRD